MIICLLFGKIKLILPLCEVNIQIVTHSRINIPSGKILWKTTPSILDVHLTRRQ
jgi:hypothetical protein